MILSDNSFILIYFLFIELSDECYLVYIVICFIPFMMMDVLFYAFVMFGVTLFYLTALLFSYPTLHHSNNFLFLNIYYPIVLDSTTFVVALN